MQAINIVGYAKSGKTRLVHALANTLEQQGLQVGIIKHSHHPFDKANTDTAKFIKKNRIVVGLNDDETTMYFGYGIHIHTALLQMPVDIVLIEGGKTLDFLPRVLCLRPQDIAKEAIIQEEIIQEELIPLKPHLAIAVHSADGDALPQFLQNIPHFPTYSSDGTGEQAATPEHLQKLAALIRERALILPALNCGACDEGSCEKMLTHLITSESLGNNESLKQCTALHTPLHISVNGQNIGLNPFTAQLLYGAMNGMTASLKGVKKGQEIVVRWHQDQNTPE